MKTVEEVCCVVFVWLCGSVGFGLDGSMTCRICCHRRLQGQSLCVSTTTTTGVGECWLNTNLMTTPVMGMVKGMRATRCRVCVVVGTVHRHDNTHAMVRAGQAQT